MSKPNRYQKAVGKCPICGRYPTWFNNMPLTGYCWGRVNKPHEEWSRVVPENDQPYKRSHK